MSDSAISLSGLDLMLGGELPLLARTSTSDSTASLLVRGGPGVGKTVFATFLARQIATGLGCDVIYACVELLPTELSEQHSRIYGGKGGVDICIPPWSAGDDNRIRIFASVLDLGDRTDANETRRRFREAVPTLVSQARQSSRRGVRVLVVDSVSNGYGLGGESAPRLLADDLCKYCVEEGLVLIVIEENHEERPTIWSYPVDIVVEIDGRATSTGGRYIRVPKNRFGPSTAGRAEFDVDKEPRVSPPAEAYLRLRKPRGVPSQKPLWGIQALDDDPKWPAPIGVVAIVGQARNAFAREYVTVGKTLWIYFRGVEAFKSYRAAGDEWKGVFVHTHGAPTSSVEQVLARTYAALHAGDFVRCVFDAFGSTHIDRLTWLTAALGHIAHSMSIPVLVLHNSENPVIDRQATSTLYVAREANGKVIVEARHLSQAAKRFGVALQFSSDESE